MWFLSVFSIIKGFFGSIFGSKDGAPANSMDRLTVYFIVGLIVFILALVGLNHFRVKQIHQLQNQNAVAQQQVQQAVTTNQDLNHTIAQQQQTTADSVNAVEQQHTQEAQVKKKKHQLIQHKTDTIAQIQQHAQQQISQSQTSAQKEEIKKAEQNQVSQVQIQTIWQAYCNATNSANCPSPSAG